MKKTILFSMALLTLSLTSNAQFVKGLLRSAANQAVESTQNRANKEVEKKVDKEVNKAIDNLIKEKEDSLKKNNSTSTDTPENTGSGESVPPSLSRMMGAFGSKADVKHKDVYQYTAQVVMEIEMVDGEGNKMAPMTSEIFVNEKNNDVGMRSSGGPSGNACLIFDYENKCTLVLSDEGGRKSGFATVLNGDELKKYVPEEEQSTTDSEDNCFKKTGKSKTINSYSCVEYLCDNEEGSTSVWVTNDLDRKINRFFNTGMANNQNGNSGKTNFDGAPVLYHFKSKKDKSESKTLLKSFDLNKSNSISTVGYELMGISLGK